MVKRAFSTPLHAFLAAASLVGCTGESVHRVPVSGTVTIDGEPLKYGYVRFCPAGVRPSGGRLDSEGRFVLTSKKRGDGVALGTHPVVVAAGEAVSETQIRWHAPKKYNRPATSGIEVTVDGPTEDVEISLTWDGEGPFVEDRRTR